MITLMIDNLKYTPEWLEFSDGAITCKIKDLPNIASNVYLNVSPKTPCKEVINEINLVMDVLLSKYFSTHKVEYVLNMPYLPYARADRVFEQGNPNPLKVFLRNLKQYEDIFSEINISDIHNESAIYTSSISKVIKNKSQLSCFKDSLHQDTDKNQWQAVISPDKGAKNKAKTIADYLGAALICADKKRDIGTGRITETVLPDINIKTAQPRVIICDDLLDGGGTFIPLCEKLKEHGYIVDLYVTHLIAAKGLDIFKGLIDNIYYYQTAGNYINQTDVLDFNHNQ